MAKPTRLSDSGSVTGTVGRRRLLGGSARAGAGVALGLLAAHGNGAAVAAPQRQDAETPLRVFDALNQGTPLEQLEGFITPNRLFFLRNHFATPALSAADWTLTVDGAVQRPVTLTLDDLRALPSQSQLTVLECAGNGRGGFVPPAEGTQWDVSAVGTAEWTGVSLATVLERAGLQPNAVELVFQGGENPTFQRSLTRAHALQPEVLLAWAMNGEPLPADHGYPLRLVVPGWIGVASVKWLTRIQAVTTPFDGFYQRQRYVIERPDQPVVEPATSLPVRAVIARPVANAVLAPGPQLVSGFAYSGQGSIVSVEVSDGGTLWLPATLDEPRDRWAWTRWQIPWAALPGDHMLMARATDSAGNSQTPQVTWNRFGYGYNAPWPVPVAVV